MLSGAAVWRQTRRPLLVVAVLAGIAVLAAPVAARLAIDWERWHQVPEAPPAGPVWVDPDPWQMPYSHWRLRNATWQDERTIAPNTGDVLTVRTATEGGRQFWTVTAVVADSK